jgi:ABC-type nitrate/sulfonate/bicarbonate transport system substrate-binding protein
MPTRTNNKFTWPFIIVTLLIITSITLWFSTFKTTKENNGESARSTEGDASQSTINKQTVRFAAASAIITAPVLLALESNYFSDEGLNIRLIGDYASGKESFEAMLAGNADISTPATTPLVFHSFERQDYSIFVTYTTTYEGIKIIARKDRGITGPEHLKGKKIGIVAGTISQLLLDTFLAYNKILPGEIETINYNDAKELPGDLKKGIIDAVSVWEPYANDARTQMKGNAIQIPTSKVYRIAVNLATMNDYADKHPDVLKKIIRVLDRSVIYLKNNPEKAQLLLAKILNIDRQRIEYLWSDITYTISLDQLLIITMENEARWVIEHKFNNRNVKIPNYLNFINYKALEELKPEAVTIIRKTSYEPTGNNR